MKLREEKWTRCEKCGQRTGVAQAASYGCDQCGKPIDDLIASQGVGPLHVTVFHKRNDYGAVRLCSWECVFNFLKTKKAKTDDFIELPNLTNTRTPGQTIKDFWKAARGS